MITTTKMDLCKAFLRECSTISQHACVSQATYFSQATRMASSVAGILSQANSTFLWLATRIEWITCWRVTLTSLFSRRPMTAACASGMCWRAFATTSTSLLTLSLWSASRRTGIICSLPTGIKWLELLTSTNNKRWKVSLLAKKQSKRWL